MNTLAIETFLAIIETKSLSKASEKLFVSQSTISTRLNSLEEELKAQLFKRHPGRKIVELTPKGEEFVTIAKRWMALQKDTAMWISKKPPLRLNVGSVDSLNIYLMTPLYKDIITSSPNFVIDVSSHSSIQVFDLLESHDIDIGLTSRLIRSNSLLSEPICGEGMVLVSSCKYSTYEDTVHPQDLDVGKEIFLDWGPNFQIWHDYWWDPTEPIRLTVDTAGLILKFIDIPDSWAIVPITIANSFEEIHPIKISNLKVAPDHRLYYKVVHRNPRPSSIEPLKIFEDYLDRFISQHPHLQVVK